MIVFTREINRVDVDFDSGTRKISLEPTLNVSGAAAQDQIYLSVGPLDYVRQNSVLNFPVQEVSGRPNDNAPDVAEWLSDTYFFGNNYGVSVGGGGLSTEPKQDVMISELQDVEAAVVSLKSKTKGYDITESYDSKEIIYFVGGGLDGKMSYIIYKTGGRFGTEVARRTLYYDGNNELQYTEKT